MRALRDLLRLMLGAVRAILRFRVPATPMAKVTIRALGTYAILQGAGICWGGIERWVGPGYTIIRALPGSPWTWGITLTAAGVTILAGSLTHTFWTKLAGLFLFAVWSFCFGFGALWATAAVPSAGTTGGPVYILTMVVALAVIFVDEKRPADYAHPH